MPTIKFEKVNKKIIFFERIWKINKNSEIFDFHAEMEGNGWNIKKKSRKGDDLRKTTNIVTNIYRWRAKRKDQHSENH